MLASGDSSRYSDMNQSFHYEIWNASGNEKLVTMLSELWNGLSMGVQMTEMEYAKKSFVEHKEIMRRSRRRTRRPRERGWRNISGEAWMIC